MSHNTIEGDIKHGLRKAADTSMIGTSIEFYDFFIFATAAAIVFPKTFFPAGVSPLVALIASFSTFAIGFFGPLAVLYTETLATKVRYSGTSRACQLGTLIGRARTVDRNGAFCPQPQHNSDLDVCGAGVPDFRSFGVADTGNLSSRFARWSGSGG